MVSDGCGFVRVEFRGEWSFSHSCAIGLDCSVDPPDFIWTDTQSGEYGSHTGVGGGNIGIGPKVYIKHSCISTFDQNLLPIMIGTIGVLNRIHSHGLDPIRNRSIISQLLLHINIQPRMRRHHLLRQRPKPQLKILKIMQIPHPNPTPTNLTRIRRPNPLLRRPNLIPPQPTLILSINLLMKIKDNVRPITHQDPSFVGYPRLFEVVEFVEEGGYVDDDSVADDAGGGFVEYSGGEEVEFVFFVVGDDCVAGVGSSGNSCAYVVFLREYIDKFALALIPPLSPQDHINSLLVGANITPADITIPLLLRLFCRLGSDSLLILCNSHRLFNITNLFGNSLQLFDNRLWTVLVASRCVDAAWNRLLFRIRYHTRQANTGHSTHGNHSGLRMFGQ
mmetsp:Transcript_17672/g.21089  ORF Transcript_17672/g.21089 Transcript_17672/m.21089 type:complete len:391 (-) Transcript_17672:21-1193(-)